MRLSTQLPADVDATRIRGPMARAAGERSRTESTLDSTDPSGSSEVAAEASDRRQEKAIAHGITATAEDRRHGTAVSG